MRPNERFSDITQRMMLFERFWGFEGQIEWVELLGYQDVSSVSRVISGSSGISQKAINNICRKAGITEKQFRAPLWELAEALDVADEAGVAKILEELSDATGELPEVLQGDDKNILREIVGNYVLLYPGREDLDFNRRHVIVEKFEISPCSRMECDVMQLGNFITGEKAKGKLTVRSGRITFNLSYAKTYYIDSNFLMTPLFFSRAARIFGGLYLDTAPTDQHQIFSTRFCMFNVDKIDGYPRRYPMDHPLFELWNPLLANFDADGQEPSSTSIKERNRLIARSDENYVDAVRGAVLETRKKEERS